MVREAASNATALGCDPTAPLAYETGLVRPGDAGTAQASG